MGFDRPRRSRGRSDEGRRSASSLCAMADQIYNAIFIGSIYALFALGFTLVFSVLDILNLAHPALFTLGAFVALFAMQQGVPAALGDDLEHRGLAHPHPAHPAEVRSGPPGVSGGLAARRGLLRRRTRARHA